MERNANETQPFVVCLLLSASLASTAFAHGTSKHLMGTAQAVEADRLVVRDQSGGDHDVKVAPETKYRDADGKAAKPSDVRSGDRVVVHFGKQGALAPASEIRFNHPTP